MKKVLYDLKKYPLAVFSAFVLFLVILTTILAPVLAPCDPTAVDILNITAGPSAEHLLGTDMQGRDVFSRLLYGGRTALLSPLFVVAIATIIGVPIGLISGYMGDKIDNLIMRICEIVLAFPSMLIALLTVAFLGRGLQNAIAVLGLFYIPMVARMVRAQVIVQKEQNYVEACAALGFSTARTIFVHILPNCVSAIIVQATLCLGYAMLDLAALSYLGLGVQPPQSDWGYMLSEGKQVLTFAPWLSLSAGIAIMITACCFNFLGDGIDDFLDPKRKRM